MRETLYQIKSPTSKGTPYKDWATTGTILAFTVVYYFHSSYQLNISGFSSLHCTIFIVCSQGGQSASNSNRSATELEELLRNWLTKASDLKHVWVSLPILVKILRKFTELSKPLLCHSNTWSMLYLFGCAPGSPSIPSQYISPGYSLSQEIRLLSYYDHLTQSKRLP